MKVMDEGSRMLNEKIFKAKKIEKERCRRTRRRVISTNDSGFELQVKVLSGETQRVLRAETGRKSPGRHGFGRDVTTAWNSSYDQSIKGELRRWGVM